MGNNMRYSRGQMMTRMPNNCGNCMTPRMERSCDTCGTPRMERGCDTCGTLRMERGCNACETSRTERGCDTCDAPHLERNCNSCDNTANNCNDHRWKRDELRGMPLAMAYVPWQEFGCTYEPMQALRAGTIFPELDKAFYGRRGLR